MRALLFILLLASMPPGAVAAQRAGGAMAARVHVLTPERLRFERAPDRRDRGSARLILTHPSHPLVAVIQRPGDPPCSVTPVARAGAELEADLRCTPVANRRRIVRLLIVPAA